MDNLKYVGKSYSIQDALEKVTGEKIYTGDMEVRNLKYAKLLLSPFPHGKIIDIDISKAEIVDGVVGIFTYKNTPNKKYNNFMSYAGQTAPKDERLFDEIVRFVGDRVAVVVADTPEIAEYALGKIKVKYERLPNYISPKNSIKEGAYPIHKRGNLLESIEYSIGNVEEVLKSNEKINETSIYIQKIHHGAIETHVCLADCDLNNKITVYTPCQGSFGVRHQVAEFSNMNYSDIRVIKTTTGGSFGGKQQSILEILTAWLSKETGSPVLLEFDRKESIIATSVATAFDFNVKSCLNKNNKIIAMEIIGQSDAGAYVTNSIALTHSAGKKAFRLYDIENMTYKCDVAYTNTPPAGGFRGWGGAQINTAIELHINSIARKYNICPVELRLKNLVNPNAIDPILKQSLGNAQIKKCLLKGAEVFNWKEKSKRIQNEGRFIRGIGVACGSHMNGYYGASHDFSNMILKMNEDGTFILNTAVHEQGCGNLISLAVIVGEVLDINPNKIRVLEADTERSPYDQGTYSSRVTYVSGRCAYEAAKSIKDLILKQAEIFMGLTKSRLTINDGFVVEKGNEENKMSYGEIAIKSHLKSEMDIMVLQKYSNTSNPGSFGSHFVEVEVDIYTGLVRVVDYVAVHDVGKAINKTMVEGQIEGAIQMGIGYALTEEVSINEKGYPTTLNFDKYQMINAPDIPNVRTVILEEGGDDGPFFAKSIGEAALVPSVSAVASAVQNALNIELRELPFTPEKILEALNNDKGEII